MNRSSFELQIRRLQCFKKSIDPELIEAYWEKLCNETEEDLRACITRILQEDRLFPKIPRFKQILSSLKTGGRPLRINGTHPQSFHCTVCDVDFSVIFGSNDNRVVPCEGIGKSNCGRTWTIGVLKSRLIDSSERQQDSVQL